MTCTNQSLFAASETQVFTLLAKAKLPALVAWKIGCLLKKLLPETQTLQTARLQWFTEERSIFSGENTRTLRPEFIPQFTQEMGELLSGSQELTLPTITLQELESVEFTPEQLDSLLPFITVE